MKQLFYYIYGRPLYILCLWSVLFAGLWGLLKCCINKKRWVMLSRVATAGFVCVIVYYTIMMRHPAGGVRLQLVPFLALLRSASKWGLLQSMWLNVILFVPYGVFSHGCFSERTKKSFFKCICICAVISICIESIQFLARLGEAETDDVILNTLGGGIGYGLSALFDRLYGRRSIRNGK